MRSYLLSFLFITLTMACKNHSTVESVPKISAEPVAAEPIAEDAAPQREPLMPDTFRVVASFISIGEGTDPEATPKLEGFLDNYRSRTGNTVSYEMQPWGREGEVDCNFTLRGLTATQQADFVEQLQKAMKDEKLILITENKVNRFKR